MSQNINLTEGEVHEDLLDPNTVNVVNGVGIGEDDEGGFYGILRAVPYRNQDQIEDRTLVLISTGQINDLLELFIAKAKEVRGDG